MSPLRPLDLGRCPCGARLHVKLSRGSLGEIRRETYCAAHDGSVELTALTARRELIRGGARVA